MQEPWLKFVAKAQEDLKAAGSGSGDKEDDRVALVHLRDAADYIAKAIEILEDE